MYICYVDESGVPEPNGGTSHYVLLGMAIPAARWKELDGALSKVKAKHALANVEVHTAWMARHYPEQERVAGFATMSRKDRRIAVERERKVDLGKAGLRGEKAVASLRKNYKKTEAYVEHTHDQRIAALRALADEVGSWSDGVMFADVQRKDVTNGNDAGRVIADFAFQQVLTRFHTFLTHKPGKHMGLVVCDQNQAMSTHLTERVRRFHVQGTLWSDIPRIVETPLFVDSRLTAMVQVADLASYAVRRFIEQGETDLLDRVYNRFDRAGKRLVGLRHYTGSLDCSCRFCVDHQRV